MTNPRPVLPLHSDLTGEAVYFFLAAQGLQAFAAPHAATAAGASAVDAITAIAAAETSSLKIGNVPPDYGQSRKMSPGVDPRLSGPLQPPPVATSLVARCR
tara:strand:+ start:1247 stop:1549 length:303 start_codon:yes stop_codon:yes gene_type:complete